MVVVVVVVATDFSFGFRGALEEVGIEGVPLLGVFGHVDPGMSEAIVVRRWVWHRVGKLTPTAILHTPSQCQCALGAPCNSLRIANCRFADS